MGYAYSGGVHSFKIPYNTEMLNSQIWLVKRCWLICSLAWWLGVSMFASHVWSWKFESHLCPVWVEYVCFPWASGVSSGHSDFLLQSKDMSCRLTDISKLSVVCAFALWWVVPSRESIVSPALCPEYPDTGSRLPLTLCSISGVEMDGLMFSY